MKNPTRAARFHLTKETTYDLAVIGGGPAGMMAAGRAAERGLKVILLEKNSALGKKLLISGGGRCNVTNAEFDNRALLAKFKESGKFLFSAFAQHSVKESLDFFHATGMKTKVEEGQRVFPLSDKAQSVWDVLLAHMKDAKHGGSNPVIIRDNAEVVGFESKVVEGMDSRLRGNDNIEIVDSARLEEAVSSTPKNEEENGGVKRVGHKIITGVRLLNGEVIRARSFILATGGKSHPETGSTGDGFAWLAKLGHTIAPPMAALVPIVASDPWVKALSGVSLKNAKITLFQNGGKIEVSGAGKVGGGVGKKVGSAGKISEGKLGAGGVGKIGLEKISGAVIGKSGAEKIGVKRGKVLFTHFGLSGPAILNMSSEVNELMKYGDVIISIDLLPEHDYSMLNESLQKLFTAQSNKKFKNAVTELIPAAFVPVVMEKAGIESDTFCHSVTREQRLALIKIFKGLEIHPTGLLGADKAIITSGGVVLPEVDFRTMQSRKVPNLFLVGDILNIDRPSGGYSLQLCWTTGWVAGNSVSSVSGGK